jgi:RNA recognition motif-containing protein
MKLYVGNLPYQASEADLQEWFTQAGISADSVTLVRDRFTGDPRGFGFVEISKDEDAELAIRICNGKDFLGRALVVNEARPQSQPGGGGAAGRRGGGGGRGGRRRPPRW